MKILVTLVLFLINSQYSQAQEFIYLDENGTEISEIEYQNKWRDKELFLSRWDSLGNDKKRYATLKKDLYLKGDFNYTDIKKQLKKITNRKISDTTIILLEYYYKDDLCTTFWDNNWTKNDISNRKRYTNPIRKTIEKNNIFYIVLFESGMTLKNKLNNENEYYFIDKDNFFRKKLFVSQTICGSFALIKPSGQALVRNGEYNAEDMTEHLKPDIWNLFFETVD